MTCLEARPGLLLGDPALAAWLARTALAAGDDKSAVRTARTAQALADALPRFPALAAAAAHSQGLARCDPASLAKAAAQHPDPWARASAAEDLGVLVAQGLNNNQVAARMYISTHTVAHHLRQAFRKLSIASRVELTRIIIERATDGS